MSLDPDRDPITRPVFVWVEVTAQVTHHGNSGLATAIQQAMARRRLDGDATFAVRIAEKIRVNDQVQGWSGEQVPDSGTHLAT